MKEFIFKYLETDAGWIDVELSHGDFKSNYYISYVFNSPLDIIEWAEKLSQGQNTEFLIDAEGWFWGMGYDGENVSIFDSLSLNDDNPEYEKKIRAFFPYDRKELCGVIYSSFISFIHSDVYNPEEWEIKYEGDKLLGYESRILELYLKDSFTYKLPPDCKPWIHIEPEPPYIPLGKK